MIMAATCITSDIQSGFFFQMEIRIARISRKTTIGPNKKNDKTSKLGLHGPDLNSGVFEK